MFWKSAISATLRIVGSIFAFLGNIFVARALGPDGAGLYFLALSTVIMLSVGGRSGLDFAILKFISHENAKSDYEMAQKYFTSAFVNSLARSTILAAALIFCADAMADVIFSKPALEEILTIMAGSIVFYSLWMICAEALKAIKKPISLMVLSSIVNPSLFILFVWWFTPSLGAGGAALAFLLSTLVTCLLCYTLWRRAVPYPHRLLALQGRRDLKASSRKMLTYTIVNEAIIPWSPLFLLGVWGTSSSAGYFGAASRISLFILAFLMLTHTILTPYITDSIRQNRIGEAVATARKSSLLLLLLTSPLFMVIFFYPSEVMLLFGPNFEDGWLSLLILCAGRFIQVLSGPTAVILMVMGKEKTLQSISLVSAAALLLLAAFLIPSYGATGAAASASGGIILGAFWSFFSVYKTTGQVVYPRW